MFTIITYIPGIIAAFMTYVWSAEFAFVFFYCPVLLLLPQIFLTQWGNLPHLSFAQAAIIPIAIGTFINRIPLWRFGINDVLFAAYLACFYYSELSAPSEGGYENMKIEPFVNLIFPYILAKILIHPTGNSINFAKCFVMCIVIDIVLSPYEMRFSMNPYYQFLLPFFPISEASWITLYRFGFVRFAGPFIQSILMGIGITIAFLLHYWLWRNKLWPKYFKWIPIPIINKRLLIGIILILGMIFTFSRGPLVGLLVGAFFLNLGYSKHIMQRVIISVILLSIGAYFAFETIQSYSMGDMGGSEVTQEDINAVYRINLMKQYWEIAWEKPVWGWGSGNIPLSRSMLSVDNQYLWLFLKNGGVMVFIFISMFVINLIRLFIKGVMCDVTTQRLSRSLAFTFFSIYVALGLTLTTVFMGNQIEQIFFILLGWSDSFITSRNSEALLTKSNKKSTIRV